MLLHVYVLLQICIMFWNITIPFFSYLLLPTIIERPNFSHPLYPFFSVIHVQSIFYVLLSANGFVLVTPNTNSQVYATLQILYFLVIIILLIIFWYFVYRIVMKYCQGMIRFYKSLITIALIMTGFLQSLQCWLPLCCLWWNISLVSWIKQEMYCNEV